MTTASLRVLEIVRGNEKLRCYVAPARYSGRRVRARLSRCGKIVEENVFDLDAQLPAADLLAFLERTFREIAAAAGGRLRILHVAP